jgi:hypothetical protein
MIDRDSVAEGFSRTVVAVTSEGEHEGLKTGDRDSPERRDMAAVSRALPSAAASVHDLIELREDARIYTTSTRHYPRDWKQYRRYQLKFFPVANFIEWPDSLCAVNSRRN